MVHQVHAHGVNVINIFSLSMTLQARKLQRLTLARLNSLVQCGRVRPECSTMILKDQSPRGPLEEHNLVYHVRVLHAKYILLALATNIRLGC